MGVTRCYKTEVIFTFISAVCLQYFMLFRLTCLMNRKSISKPKFDKISQSMAKMNYFRLRKTDCRHIGFPFQVSILTYV